MGNLKKFKDLSKLKEIRPVLRDIKGEVPKNFLIESGYMPARKELRRCADQGV
jgi:hypothetical protein